MNDRLPRASVIRGSSISRHKLRDIFAPPVPGFSLPSSAWQRRSRSSASHLLGRNAKQSFARVRSQAELGNEGLRQCSPPVPGFSLPSSAWQRRSRSSASHLLGRNAKQSFARVRCQAELGNEGLRTCSPPLFRVQV